MNRCIVTHKPITSNKMIGCGEERLVIKVILKDSFKDPGENGCRFLILNIVRGHVRENMEKGKENATMPKAIQQRSLQFVKKKKKRNHDGSKTKSENG